MRECATRRRNGPELLQPSKPGYLVLPPEAHSRLVKIHEPIEEQYDIEPEPFARGKYATVCRCRHLDTRQVYAAKRVKTQRRSVRSNGVVSPANEDEIRHEVAVLYACAPCPHIVNLHSVYIQPTETVLLLELAPGGDLQSVLDAGPDTVIEEHVARKFMKQILAAVQHLHLKLNVVHLDIKPQNVVLTGDYPNCDVKLCDFGISRYVGESSDIKEILGTPDYVAPEVLSYDPISLATDMWSVGVLIYVLLTGCSPFGGDTKQETFCNISQAILEFPEQYFKKISEEAQDLMSKLMVKKPSDRLTVEQCLAHSWFELDDKPPPLPTTPPPKNFNQVQSPLQLTNRKSLPSSIVTRSPSLRKPAPETPVVIKRACSSNTAPVDDRDRDMFRLMDRLEMVAISPKIDENNVSRIVEEVKKVDLDVGTTTPSTSDSDCVSDMSIDSSAECASLESSLGDCISTGDSLSNFGSDDWTSEMKTRKWDGMIRAKSSLNLSEGTMRKNVLKRFYENLGPTDRGNYSLKLLQESNGNEVVIREVKGGRVSKFGGLKCESVKSRIKKLESRC